MIDSRNKIANASEPEVAFVRGFVGVFGVSAQSQTLKLAQPLGEGIHKFCAAPSIKVLSYGVSPTTLEVSHAHRSLLVKGRPFAPSKAWAIDGCEENARELEKRLLELDGRYSLVAELAQARYVLATDIIGSGSIFYAEHSGLVYFSTHLGPLIMNLPAIPDFDRAGLVALYCGYFAGYGGQTIYAGVSRLQPCEYLVLSAGDDGRAQIQKSSYSDLESCLAATRTHDSEEKSLLEFDNLLQASLAREQLPSDEMVLFLSGGYDSRVLGYGLQQSNDWNRRALTYGERGSREVRAAAAMAAGFDVREWLVLQPKRLPYAAYLETVLALHGGCSVFLGGMIAAGAHAMRGWAQLAPVGFLGDVALKFAAEPGVLTCENTLENLFFQSKWILENSIWLDEFQAMKSDFFRRWNAMSSFRPTQRSFLLNLMLRQSSYISISFDSAEFHLPFAYPFFSREILKFGLHLSDKLQVGRKFFDLWLERKRVSSLCRKTPVARLRGALAARGSRWERRGGVVRPGYNVAFWREGLTLLREHLLSAADASETLDEMGGGIRREVSAMFSDREMTRLPMGAILFAPILGRTYATGELAPIGTMSAATVPVRKASPLLWSVL